MALKNLRRIKVSNFYSFNSEPQEIFFISETKYSSEAGFDFIKINTKKNEHVLPVTLIYGANASGKSNFVRIIEAISKLLRRVNSENTKKMPGNSFDKSSEPISLEFEFILNDVIYTYNVKYSEKEILYEEFSTFNANNSLKRLFVRNGLDVAWHKSLSVSKSTKDEIKERFSTRSDITVLEILNLRNLQPYSDVYNFLSQEEKSNVFKRLYEDVELRNIVLSFLRHADTGIVDLTIEKVPDKARMDLMKKIAEFDSNVRNLSEDLFYFPLFKHKGINKKLNPGEESDGTDHYLNILTKFLPKLLKEGGVLIADELDAGLHPLLMQKIIEMFHDKRINKCGAQLVITTHNVSLMAPQIIARDEVWFVEKDPNKGNSVIYPLSSFTDIRSNYDYKTGYLKGRFGGVPYLGSVDSLVKIIEDE